MISVAMLIMGISLFTAFLIGKAVHRIADYLFNRNVASFAAIICGCVTWGITFYGVFNWIRVATTHVHMNVDPATAPLRLQEEGLPVKSIKDLCYRITLQSFVADFELPMKDFLQWAKQRNIEPEEFLSQAIEPLNPTVSDNPLLFSEYVVYPVQSNGKSAPLAVYYGYRIEVLEGTAYFELTYDIEAERAYCLWSTL